MEIENNWNRKIYIREKMTNLTVITNVFLPLVICVYSLSPPFPSNETTLGYETENNNDKIWYFYKKHTSGLQKDESAEDWQRLKLRKKNYHWTLRDTIDLNYVDTTSGMHVIRSSLLLRSQTANIMSVQYFK